MGEMVLALLYLGVIVVTPAVIAVRVDRAVYQRRKYDDWLRANNHLIADVEAKAADVQSKLNFVYGQLLALGIKLPEAK